MDPTKKVSVELGPAHIDEFLLIVHPTVLGEGGRLFRHDGESLELELIEGKGAESGLILATYRRGEAGPAGDPAGSTRRNGAAL
jgi:dihydrofolate reductase